tara:strand:+ start:24276 stop:25211 length:936 start_codon:yes stop_codon:yes gene_type:complete
MKKVLVTGGAGFIGSHLCKKLITMGNYIFCVDNLYTGDLDNLENILNHKNFKFIEHDICNKIDLKIDEIYNFACPASPVHYQTDPIFTMRTSVLGSFNLLNLAKKYNSKILHASTSEVYGDPKVHPQDELYFGNVNPLGPRSCYDEGKRCSETIFYDYKRQKDLNVKIIRIFNTYGPNMAIDDGRVISNFIVQALRNEDITVYGDGSQTRSFQFIDDLIDGIFRMMNTEKFFFGPVNLGNPYEYTILEIANKIIQLTNSESKIKFLPLPIDDPTRRKPVIDKAFKELGGWKPQIKLDFGLDQTIKYFKNKI